MPREKEIKLAPFQYPFEGKMHTGDTVIVSETTFKTQRIDSRMRHCVMRAILGISKSFGTMENAKAQNPETIDEDGNIADDRLMDMVAMGFEDGEAFEQFEVATISSLTNRPSLCRVADTGAPLTEQAWASIDETNGLDGIRRICSAFTSFFFERLQSMNGNGAALSTTSQSPTKVAPLLSSLSGAR